MSAASITTSAAADALGAYAARLATATNAKSAADDFLGVLGRQTGDAAYPIRASHAEIEAVPALRDAWNDMHSAVRGALERIDTAPRFGTAGIRDARSLVQRVIAADARMMTLEANPAMIDDVSGLAFSIRSRLDDVAGRGHDAVAAEAQLLRSITGA